MWSVLQTGYIFRVALLSTTGSVFGPWLPVGVCVRHKHSSQHFLLKKTSSAEVLRSIAFQSAVEREGLCSLIILQRLCLIIKLRLKSLS